MSIRGKFRLPTVSGLMDLVFHVMVARLADWLLLTLAVLMTLDMRSLQEEEVVLVKVDSNARQPRDCTAAIDKTRVLYTPITSN